ncbi:hypothetical protein [Thermodesulfovibrio yellowstonii]|uniref:Uncharacterized protein n=1 Tax=Thermodesulfovibrio yellowstonii (strain ATCC 51303 / DSM 11347 / YP87) TaxID=289376 RepID=B5YJB9_THEYD|nr:hypothetical protein [Thermodesulfovibrio yellowstonii]ACI21073.1 hypothetical protein THEYE_A0489 [Thermodesulfovibrio yellowstonii DSM 11347]
MYRKISRILNLNISEKMKGFFMCICLFILMSPFILMKTGIGEDDAAIILASINLSKYEIFTPNLFKNLIANLFNYSHGWMNLVWSYFWYYLLNLFNIPLYTWVFIFPSTSCIFLSMIGIYFFTYNITKNYKISFFSSLIFITFPIILGLARSYTITISLPLFMRTWFLLSIVWVLNNKTKFNMAFCMILMGALICSENVFYFPIFLAIVLIFLFFLQKNLQIDDLKQSVLMSLKNTLLFFKNPFIIIPFVIIFLYVIAFICEEILSIQNGFLRYPFIRHEGKGIVLGLPENFLKQLISHLGYGIFIIFTLISVYLFYFFKKKINFNGKSYLIIFLYTWMFLSIFLIFLYSPKNNAMHFISWATPPMCIIFAIGFHYFFNKTKKIMGMFIIMIVTLNFLSTISIVFDKPFELNKIYGSSVPYNVSHTFKAVGTILRNEKYAPVIDDDQTTIKFDDLIKGIKSKISDKNNSFIFSKRNLIKQERKIVLAGIVPGTKKSPYLALFYWGADVAHIPDNKTLVIINIKEFNENKEHKINSLNFAKDNNFSIKYVLYDKDEPVCWMFYKNYKGPVVKYQIKELCDEFDKKYASIKYIKTPWAHAL